MATRGWLLLFALPLLAQVAPDGFPFTDYYWHDAFILAHKLTATYYLYSAALPNEIGGQRHGVVLRKSKDLQHWDRPITVLEIPDGIWANPTVEVVSVRVHEYDGRFYLLATLSNTERPRSHLRGTQIFVADKPDGPFTPIGEGPATPDDRMAINGTLFVEDGVPYVVYGRDLLDLREGRIEAVALKPDLTERVGGPFLLFTGSDAALAGEKMGFHTAEGPCLYRTRTGKLLMLWSTYQGKHVERLAYSTSGKLRGPWKQGGVLYDDGRGGSVLFETFTGDLMRLAFTPPYRQGRTRLYELEDTGDSLRVRSK